MWQNRNFHLDGTLGFTDRFRYVFKSTATNDFGFYANGPFAVFRGEDSPFRKYGATVGFSCGYSVRVGYGKIGIGFQSQYGLLSYEKSNYQWLSQDLSFPVGQNVFEVTDERGSSHVYSFGLTISWILDY